MNQTMKAQLEASAVAQESADDGDEDDFNSLIMGDIPEELVENPDGSVDVMSITDPDDQDEFSGNLAEKLSDGVLQGISSQLIELIDQDKESRKKRDEQYEEGLRRTGLGDDAPGGASFTGASRVVHPVLAEGCVDFASRAIKELFPSSGPVKSWIIGKSTPQKLERAQRKVKFMNWQLTTQIPEYRDQLEQLLTQLPMGGSQYQKFWPDELQSRPAVEFVPIDEVFLPYQATNFYTAPRATHRYPLSRDDFRRRVERGYYRDVFIGESAPGFLEVSNSATANDKIEGREDDGYNEEGYRNILEIYLWLEVEDDIHSEGAYAPYILTIDEDTEKVLSLYRNWKEGDTKFTKLDWWVEWKFIPWRGAYAIGLPHLIGGLSASLTGALRALLDSAHINNAATLIKMKGGRMSGSTTSVNVTQIQDVDCPPNTDDIRKIVMAMPFNPPSPVLMGLLDKLYGLAKGVITTAEDAMSNVGNRTPVGTTMALIEQGSPVYSSIHARLHNSQKKALEIIHRINGDYLDEELVIEELGEEVITREDFHGSMDVIPVSDPTIFSEAQRYAQVQSLLQMSQDQRVQWNVPNIYRRALRQMRIEGLDEILPPEKNPVTAELSVENSKALLGFPLKADERQNHFLHLQGHLKFISSPVQMQNPLTPPQVLMGMLSHVNEHIQMLEAQLIVSAAQQFLISGQAMDPEHATVMAMSQPPDVMYGKIMPIIQQITQIQQALAQKVAQANPPQMPPEVQASLQIAQMDTQRKKAFDDATIQLKQADQQRLQQESMMRFQVEQTQSQFNQHLSQMQEQFRQQMEQARFQSESQAQEMREQIKLLMNRADNLQKQQTELMKNRDDNSTKLEIAEGVNQHELGMAGAQNHLLEPKFEQLQSLLSSLEGDRSTMAMDDVYRQLSGIVRGDNNG